MGSRQLWRSGRRVSESLSVRLGHSSRQGVARPQARSVTGRRKNMGRPARAGRPVQSVLVYVQSRLPNASGRDVRRTPCGGDGLLSWWRAGVCLEQLVPEGLALADGGSQPGRVDVLALDQLRQKRHTQRSWFGQMALV